MKRCLVIHLGEENENFTAELGHRRAEVLWRGCGRDLERARSLIREHDGMVDAIGLDGIPLDLELGEAHRRYRIGRELAASATKAPVVDGGGVRPGLERWSVVLADRAEPGIFSQKRVLMVPGLNHVGLANALGRLTPRIDYFDPEIFFGLPDVPGIGSAETLGTADAPTLEALKDAPVDRISPSADERAHRPAPHFKWADVIVGDAGTIRHYAPIDLRKKTVVVPCATDDDIEGFRVRGASILVTLMPSLEGAEMARHSAAVIEAVLVALRDDPTAPLTEDSYLNLMAEISWKPSIRYLQAEEQDINRFAFVIHPLDIRFVHRHPDFKWTKYLPDRVVEEAAAYLNPMYVGRIDGGCSPTTGQRIEGYLFALGSTPRQMMRHSPRFTYDRLNEAAKMAERKGCRLMGLGAFTSVVGDAGKTVAHEAAIAITSGNSLTVAATLEAAKQAVVKMGATNLKEGRAMIIGATGSIGAVCSRLLAQAIYDVVLVSIEPEKLIDLKRTIERETPGTKVTIALRPANLAAECDLVVTATSAFGQRILDISTCKPGGVICDVARPPDIGEKEAALRPDVAVIESGEVLIPGDIDIGYDIGLPKGTAYACLAETALLAMEGRFESFTLGRNIDMQRVKEIYRLFKKHDFKIAGLRSFGKVLSEEDFAEKRRLAAELASDPDRLARKRIEVSERIAEMPVEAKGVQAGSETVKRITQAAERIPPLAGALQRLRVYYSADDPDDAEPPPSIGL
jgi:predicted amino acid dehydrogenase